MRPYRVVYQVIRTGVFVEKFPESKWFYDKLVNKIKHSKTCRLVSCHEL